MTSGAANKLTRDAPRPSERKTPAREWIIQRCLNAFRNEYEDWPGYCERLLTREEMLERLRECETRWPDHEFRGHNVVNQHTRAVIGGG
jgi:hypothetical protein